MMAGLACTTSRCLRIDLSQPGGLARHRLSYKGFPRPPLDGVPPPPYPPVPRPPRAPAQRSRRTPRTRSLFPFPDRAVICRYAKSTSCTRNRTHSVIRNPLPYSNHVTRPAVPSIKGRMRCTSPRANTTGTRASFTNRAASIRPSNSTFSTFRYKNTNACIAWF